VPSIELVCVGQELPSKLPRLPFAVVSEPALESHRVPSFFQSHFDELQGCIYHLGCPGYDSPDFEGMYNAWELLSEACREAETERFLEFDSQFLPALFDLVGLLLEASPEGRVLFTSDWQFGPALARIYRPLVEREFWEIHARRGLRFNALYPITP
jgi:hypothetical protein